MQKPLKTTPTNQLQNSKEHNLNKLAVDRNLLAAQRTLMAWIRTSLSMISFGFTIYKFMEVMQQQNNVAVVDEQTPRNVGLTLIGIGTFALIIACIQHYNYLTELLPNNSYKFWKDLSFIVACLLGVLGLLMFANITFNAGPLQ